MMIFFLKSINSFFLQRISIEGPELQLEEMTGTLNIIASVRTLENLHIRMTKQIILQFLK